MLLSSLVNFGNDLVEAALIPHQLDIDIGSEANPEAKDLGIQAELSWGLQTPITLVINSRRCYHMP